MTVIAALAGCNGSDETPAEDTEPTVVSSGDCLNEPAVVRDARRTWGRSADIDGDGASDAVYLADDPGAGPRCRRFVAVDTGDVTYSAPADVLGYPEITGAAVFRLIQLGGSEGAEIVFSAYGTRIGAVTVYQLFTFSDGRLRPVTGPYGELVDDPSKQPVGAGCSGGGFVVSEASGSDPARRRAVDRRFFALRGDRLEPRGESRRGVAPGTPLAAALPEFTRPLFGGC